MDLEKIGEKFGFVLMFFISSAILFFVLKILNKLPSNWSYFHILVLVFIITIIGMLIKRWLK
jgi:hypothetical protein